MPSVSDLLGFDLAAWTGPSRIHRTRTFAEKKLWLSRATDIMLDRVLEVTLLGVVVDDIR